MLILRFNYRHLLKGQCAVSARGSLTLRGARLVRWGSREQDADSTLAGRSLNSSDSESQWTENRLMQRLSASVDGHVRNCIHANMRLSRCMMIKARGHLNSKGSGSEPPFSLIALLSLQLMRPNTRALSSSCQKFALITSKQFSSFLPGHHGLHKPNNATQTQNSGTVWTL